MSSALVKLKIQIINEGTIAFGPGKADLLDAIAQAGSISAAGRALGMSYRRAWLLVDEINRCFASPLVETVVGGGHDRGARLTASGQDVLAAYRRIQQDALSAIDKGPMADIRALMRPEPAAPRQRGGAADERQVSS